VVNIEELDFGTKVEDTWYPDWGTGIVDNILKTRVFIKFPYPKGMMTYDVSHLQFLKEVKK
jgi:hypothetical protein